MTNSHKHNRLAAHCWCCLVALLLLPCFGFSPHVSFSTRPVRSVERLENNEWELFMGKKSLNKQAELRRKMELAKKQKQQQKVGEGGVPDLGASDAKPLLTDQEIKERNDRLRFEELLQKSSSTVLNDYSSDGYLNKQQEEAEITAQRKGVDRIFEGDSAPYNCFRGLLNVRTETPIGKAGMERLLPWLKNTDDFSQDYLVLLTDPREQSLELRQSVKTLLSELPKNILNRLAIVNADSPAENRRWMKRNGLENKLQVYSDEKREFMRMYTALGEKRWSQTMFVLSNGKVQKLAREVDEYAISRVIQKAVQALKDER